MTCEPTPPRLVALVATGSDPCMRWFLIRALCVAALFFHAAGSVHATPIEKIQGVIIEVGEGFLLVTPKGETEARKFILRWKAQFVPPKLPLKGDRVLVLYKNKEDGALIYALHYLKTTPGSSGEQPEPTAETAGQ
jgi:hypothetical protein